MSDCNALGTQETVPHIHHGMVGVTPNRLPRLRCLAAIQVHWCLAPFMARKTILSSCQRLVIFFGMDAASRMNFLKRKGLL